MKIKILDEAEQDLIDGFRFYEAHDQGLGDYFLDSLFSDIDSLQLYGVFTPNSSATIVFFPNVSPSPFTIVLREKPFESVLLSQANGLYLLKSLSRPWFSVLFSSAFFLIYTPTMKRQLLIKFWAFPPQDSFFLLRA